MTPELKRWYGFVHAQPCLACNRRGGIQAAHIEAFPSEKIPNQMQGRRLKESIFACIPLCANCHLNGKNAQHRHNEKTWLDDNIVGGRLFAIGWIARSMVKVFAPLEEADM